MTPDSDGIKGRAKEAIGAAAGDDQLRREGKGDQAAGKAKKVVDDAKQKADAAVDRVKDALRRDDRG
ncbi:CsbD family protein [Patulibacter defluvii]|uniref:CsbD family protein n=1 Tax=Patulibacter defluvii TaxID=3095358 RepID=UPI002A75136F|nr:CsbD family protein [Patulibacter sp. DM4]